MANDGLTSGPTNQGSQASQTSQDPPPIAGARVVAALVLWIVASVGIAGLTLIVARVIAPGWAANTNETATVIAAEVYAILIVTLFIVFGGRTGAATALRLRMVPARAFALAFAVIVVVIGLTNLIYILAGAGREIADFYLRLGTDGGRLGLLGPVTTLLSLSRACVLAPVGEELLFRGAIYGWSRRWLPAWPAIILNGIVWGVLSAVIGGSLVLAPQAILYGLALTWIRERTDSTLPGITVHIAHNTIVVIVVYLLIGR
jgi:membrane protease YdiL (CAAX protease family)